METARENFLFFFAAVVEGHAFRSFTEPHHGITEVGLQFLLHKVQSHQLMTHFVGNPGADDGIGQGGPYQVAVYMDGEARQRKGERFRQGPEDEDEAEYGGYRLE